MQDQAEGLRKLFAQRCPAVLNVLAPGGGEGPLVANLATALAMSGREVLLIDATPGEIAHAMGLRTRYELAHVAAGDKRLRDIIAQPMEGLRVLPASRAFADAGKLEPWLTRIAEQLTPEPDFIIVHQRAAQAIVEGDVLVAASPGRDAVTRTYAELKRMKHAKGALRLLVAHTADEAAARSLHRVLDETAQRHLSERIEWAGFVPHDASLRRAEATAKPVFAIDIASPSARALMALGRALENWELPRLAAAH